jgi:diguanylate cyclase (GGDEF)-like protein/PAS domain S-box-containing protein
MDLPTTTLTARDLLNQCLSAAETQSPATNNSAAAIVTAVNATGHDPKWRAGRARSGKPRAKTGHGRRNVSLTAREVSQATTSIASRPGDRAAKVTIPAGASVAEIISAFEEHNCKTITVSGTDGEPGGVITLIGLLHALAGHVTKQQQTPEQVAQTPATGTLGQFTSAIEQIADSVMITDKHGVIEYVNVAFEKSTGYSRAETIGKKPNIVKSGLHPEILYSNLWATILSGQPFHGTFANCRKDGTIYREQKTISPLKNQAGVITHFVSTAKDVTERFEYEQRLKYLSHHDALTGLPNRTLFLDRLSRTLLRAQRLKQPVAVLFVDLDRFKIVNDTLGHNVGDALLQAVAKRFTSCIRRGDTIARLGGDEFALILEDVATFDNVVPVVRKILAAFNQPCQVGDRELSVNTSIGVAMYPDDGTDVSSLLKHADIAMYRAKEHGGGSYRFYSSQMYTETEERLALETEMRRALERDEFVVHYQPQVNLTTGEIIAVEALVRWLHPKVGTIPPMKFIPLAEETGLIAPLGDLILRKASQQTRDWHERGFRIRVAVNFSGRQFKHADFAAHIGSMLKDTGLDPAFLEVEITESMLIGHTDTTAGTLAQLRALGAHVVIDDFGTGYSSLAYLKKLPIDTLKIDRSFVRDITKDKDDAIIVTAITTMAHTLGIIAVAEGVETREQLAYLRDCRCDIAQGYYLGRPMPAQELSHYLGVFGIPARKSRVP